MLLVVAFFLFFVRVPVSEYHQPKRSGVGVKGVESSESGIPREVGSLRRSTGFGELQRSDGERRSLPTTRGPFPDFDLCPSDSQNACMSTALELSESDLRRQEWLGRLREEFVKLEPPVIVPNFLPNDGLPTWVQNIEREIADAMFPVVKVKKLTKLTPKGMGAMLGHNCAYGVWMIESLNELFEDVADEGLTSELSAEQQALVEKFLSSVEDYYSALRRLAKRALCSVVDQSYADMTEFLRAYSQAFSRKPTARGGVAEIGNSATLIYFRMITHWRVVNAMSSVPELHQWLVKHFGPYRTGDLKRIEKICGRIQLHYRRPGRPKRPK
jgi:hypothetical protein